MNPAPSRLSDALLASLVFLASLSLGCLGSRATTAPSASLPAATGSEKFWQLKTAPDSYIPKSLPLDHPTDAFHGDWMHLERGNFFIPSKGTETHSHREIVDQALALRDAEEIQNVKTENRVYAARNALYGASGVVNPAVWFSGGCGGNENGD